MTLEEAFKRMIQDYFDDEESTYEPKTKSKYDKKYMDEWEKEVVETKKSKKVKNGA